MDVEKGGFSPRGVIPALVTPLDHGGEVDAPALASLVESVVAAGVAAISVLGSTGEGALVPAAVRRRVVEAAVRCAGGRVPVIAGSTGGPLADAAIESRAFVDLGADCILASPPGYFQIDQQAIVDYYGELADRVRAPVIVYHFPALTRVALDVETVTMLARIDGVVGLKDSGGDGGFLSEVSAAAGETGFAVLAGSGRLASAAAAAGAQGIVAASANLIPSHLVRLWSALQNGSPEAARMQALVTSIELACRQFPYPMNWKAAIRLSGLDCGRPVPPLRELNDQSHEALAQSLAHLLARPDASGVGLRQV